MLVLSPPIVDPPRREGARVRANTSLVSFLPLLSGRKETCGGFPASSLRHGTAPFQISFRTFVARFLFGSVGPGSGWSPSRARSHGTSTCFARALISRLESNVVGAPCRATQTIARAIRSVEVMTEGATRDASRKNGRTR